MTKRVYKLGGAAFSSAGGTWEERLIPLDMESVDQNLSRYFPTQMRAGTSARREKTDFGSIKYFVHIPGCQEVPYGVPHQPCIIIELIKLGEQTRFVAIANDRDRDRLIRVVEELEAFLFPDRVPTEDEGQLQKAKQTNNSLLKELYELLKNYFNEEELRELYLDLHVNYEFLSGTNLLAKAWELVSYCQRHGRLQELEAEIKKQRPHLS